MGHISSTTTVGEIVEKYPAAMDILQEAGMHCLGCPAFLAESLEDACMVHGIPTEPVLDAINTAIAQ